MFNEAKLSYSFWREVVYTTVCILNRGQLKVNKDKTPYELWYGRPASVKYLKYLEVNLTSKETRMNLESSSPGMMKELF